MITRSQPDLVTPRLAYNGRRDRVHPAPWATDQGVPNDNDPNPQDSGIRTPERMPWKERIRPSIWRRGEDDDQTATNRGCGFIINLVNTDGFGGQTIYLKEGALPTVYVAHQTEGALSFGGTGGGTTNPVTCDVGGASNIGGSYNVSTTFSAWYNQPTGCKPPRPDSSFYQIINGPCAITVNGTLVNPTDVLTIFGVADSGYNVGLTPGFGAGTPIVVVIL